MPTSRNQCDNKRRQKCNDSWRTVYDTEYEKVCDDKPTQACEKHWEDDGKGGKIWANDPATCKTIYKTECRDEERQVPRREKYETCDWETYQDCYQVTGRPKCSKVTERKCLGSCETGVPSSLQCIGSTQGTSHRPNPHFIKGSVCKESPKKECRQVHKEVPYQTHREVCPGDQGYTGTGSGTGSPIDPRDIADAFNQAIDSTSTRRPDPRSEAPVIDPRATDTSGSEEASDAIVFPN